MGKRTRPEGTASEYPIITRRGWFHVADGDVIPARELFGGCKEFHVRHHPEYSCANEWIGVPVWVWDRIEWDDGEDLAEADAAKCRRLQEELAALAPDMTITGSERSRRADGVRDGVRVHNELTPATHFPSDRFVRARSRLVC